MLCRLRYHKVEVILLQLNLKELSVVRIEEFCKFQSHNLTNRPLSISSWERPFSTLLQR